VFNVHFLAGRQVHFKARHNTSRAVPMGNFCAKGTRFRVDVHSPIALLAFPQSTSVDGAAAQTRKTLENLDHGLAGFGVGRSNIAAVQCC
jgi:hypothetical protein